MILHLIELKEKYVKIGRWGFDNITFFLAVEWVGPKLGERTVKIKFDKERKKIHVTDLRRKPLRLLDLRRIEGTSYKVHFRLACDGGENIVSIRLTGEIDLVTITKIYLKTGHTFILCYCDTQWFRNSNFVVRTSNFRIKI